jgi:hypothetical protein
VQIRVPQPRPHRSRWTACAACLIAFACYTEPLYYGAAGAGGAPGGGGAGAAVGGAGGAGPASFAGAGGDLAGVGAAAGREVDGGAAGSGGGSGGACSYQSPCCSDPTPGPIDCDSFSEDVVHGRACQAGGLAIFVAEGPCGISMPLCPDAGSWTDAVASVPAEFGHVRSVRHVGCTWASLEVVIDLAPGRPASTLLQIEGQAEGFGVCPARGVTCDISVTREIFLNTPCEELAGAYCRAMHEMPAWVGVGAGGVGGSEVGGSGGESGASVCGAGGAAALAGRG